MPLDSGLVTALGDYKTDMFPTIDDTHPSQIMKLMVEWMRSNISNSGTYAYRVEYYLVAIESTMDVVFIVYGVSKANNNPKQIDIKVQLFSLTVPVDTTDVPLGYPASLSILEGTPTAYNNSTDLNAALIAMLGDAAFINKSCQLWWGSYEILPDADVLYT